MLQNNITFLLRHSTKVISPRTSENEPIILNLGTFRIKEDFLEIHKAVPSWIALDFKILRTLFGLYSDPSLIFLSILFKKSFKSYFLIILLFLFLVAFKLSLLFSFIFICIQTIIYKCLNLSHFFLFLHLLGLYILCIGIKASFFCCLFKFRQLIIVYSYREGILVLYVTSCVVIVAQAQLVIVRMNVGIKKLMLET